MEDLLKDFLDDTGGIKPHRYLHNDSFNNVIFSAEHLVARKSLGVNLDEDISRFMNHVGLNSDSRNAYIPKNSHDNITALLAGLIAADQDISYLKKLNISSGKHPRDRIFYGMLLGSKLWWIGLPFLMFEIVRSILSKGKIRPVWWQSFYHFRLRLKVMLGIAKPEKVEPIFGGTARFYKHGGQLERVITVQNDGKLLSLLRLTILKRYSILKPFVRWCKKLYIKRLGEDFQSIMVGNYFEEDDHPVRVVYRELDKNGKTVIDC